MLKNKLLMIKEDFIRYFNAEKEELTYEEKRKFENIIMFSDYFIL